MLMNKSRSTIILTPLLSACLTPLFLKSFLPQRPQLFSHGASSLYLPPFLHLSSIWSTREMRRGVLHKNPAPCDLSWDWDRLSPRAGIKAAVTQSNEKLGAGHGGLDLCTSKRSPTQTKCFLKTCDRSTKILEFTRGNVRWKMVIWIVQGSGVWQTKCFLWP